jgi:hypothetical protein
MAQYSTEDIMDLRDAEDWGKLLEAGGARECSTFAQWARNSKAHISAFLRNTAIDVELIGLDANREFDLDRLLAEVTQSNRISWTSLGAPRD